MTACLDRLWWKDLLRPLCFSIATDCTNKAMSEYGWSGQCADYSFLMLTAVSIMKVCLFFCWGHYIQGEMKHDRMWLKYQHANRLAVGLSLEGSAALSHYCPLALSPLPPSRHNESLCQGNTRLIFRGFPGHWKIEPFCPVSLGVRLESVGLQWLGWFVL